MWKQQRGSMKACDLFLKFTEDVEWLVFGTLRQTCLQIMKKTSHGRRQKALRSQIWCKNAFLHKLTTLHRQKLGCFFPPAISTVSVLFFRRRRFVSTTLWRRLTQLRGNGNVFRTIRAVSFALNAANVPFSLQRTSRPLGWARLPPPPPPLFSAIPKGKSTCNYAAFVHSSDTLWDPPGMRGPRCGSHSAFLPPHMLLTGSGGRVKWRPKPAATSWVLGSTVNCAEVMKTLRMSEPEGHLEGDMETLSNAFPGGFSIFGQISMMKWIFIADD